jgi:hypothetical protein
MIDRVATLPGMTQLGRHDKARSPVEIGIGRNDRGRLAPTAYDRGRARRHWPQPNAPPAHCR